MEIVNCCLQNISFKNILAFNSFNGAKYLETQEGKTNLVSFSTTFVIKELLDLNNFFTTYSNSIHV